MPQSALKSILHKESRSLVDEEDSEKMGKPRAEEIRLQVMKSRDIFKTQGLIGRDIRAWFKQILVNL